MINRRGFLSQLFQTAGGLLVAPSIVTHGLKLRPYGLKLLSPTSNWSAEDVELYHALPYFIARIQIERSHTWKGYTEMLKERKWSLNMGETVMPSAALKARTLDASYLYTETPLSIGLNSLCGIMKNGFLFG